MIAINSCKVGCAKNSPEAAGVIPNRHVVVSDLGIEKSGEQNLQEQGIERVVEVAETPGTAAADRKQPPAGDQAEKSSEGGCGCGGGCSCG